MVLRVATQLKNKVYLIRLIALFFSLYRYFTTLNAMLYLAQYWLNHYIKPFKHFPSIQSNWSLHVHTPSSPSPFPSVKHVFAFSVPVHCSFILHSLRISFLAKFKFEWPCIVLNILLQIQWVRFKVIQYVNTCYKVTLPWRHSKYVLSSM